ncbi:hypothetical protein HK100_009449 [Physocladia obscura]|uniref:Uncharacterized protein n=1 Tax=Physocladia obscura TaxID=109957 RepID=A0AAD5X606_9FUNG|nr:hypothetical protein HK100_009449 [Physocladia obscura]
MEEGIITYTANCTEKNERINQLGEEEKTFIEESTEIREKFEKLSNRVRLSSTRIIGYDRNGSMYLWIDLGYSDEQSFQISSTEQNEVSDDSNEVTNENSIDIRKKYRICGILVDSTNSSQSEILKTEPSSPASATNICESQLPTSVFAYIDSVKLLKQYAKNLNDRGFRERDLLISLRERLLSTGIILPNPIAQAYRRDWRLFESSTVPTSESELEFDAGLNAFGVWIEELGKPIKLEVSARTTDTTDLNASNESLSISKNDDETTAASTTARKATRSSRLRSKSNSTDSDLPPHKACENAGINLAKERLRELIHIPGTMGKHHTTATTDRKERLEVDAIETLGHAADTASTIVSRKFGRATVSELEVRFERCETWSMFCLLIADIIRENGLKRLNEFLEDTRDGGWVEEDEDTTEADEAAKGKGIQRKSVLTRKPRKISRVE